MQKPILCAFLILLLVPFSQSFSQEYYDNAPTLTVSLKNETPFVYQDSEGYTVVVGEVKNNDSQTAVTNVRIQVNFFDESDPAPIEIVQGKTTLEVIPQNGESPFAIRSQTPNPDITQASVTLLGFDSTGGKQKGLTIFSNDVLLDSSFHFSGTLQNSGAPNSNTTAYLAFYDGFEPPRILGISAIDLGDVDSDAEITFDLNEKIDSRAVGFLLFAESSIFYSDFVDVKIPTPQSLTKLLTISDVAIKDTLGNNLSEIEIGSTVNIESKTWVQFAEDQSTNETPYTYFVQIKESGESPYVEFIGKYDGRFVGTGIQSQTIDWVPENSGLFFIETFVWDRNNVPIAEQGPFVLIHVK
ncbi:MAG: hypothetical protein HOK63_07460 [Thaumarchaeota archaeon]|jgi:hypothetical protein|nr:hypothetical protein [Nitrososphaerota archaeon]MBT6469461.1 hypothetical protein [Nitrososphaerota archaeon]